MNAMAAFVERHFRAVFAATLLALLGLAWINRFVQDDAFIIFRYARHLAAGIGPVFNPGERVEGYTCPLFMLLVAGAMRAGMDPVAAAETIGFVAFLGSLLAAFALARRLGCDRVQAWLAVVLLGTNYTFSAYATGGLETQLQTMLVLASLAIAAGELGEPRPRTARLAAFSTLAGLAVLTRLDSALLVTPIAIVLLARTRDRAAALAALLAPGALLVGAWLMWESRYYGTLVPNTFQAKVGARASLPRGFYYLLQFVTSYWLEGVLVVALWLRRDVLESGGSVGRPLLLTVALWLTYIIAVGGDFMEFRMLVPVLPILAWLVVATVIALERRARLGLALVALTLAGSFTHAVTYSFTEHPDQNESVRELAGHMRGGEDWPAFGRALARDLGADSTVLIATTASGAIPYYAGLRTVDELGLSDPWIAAHGDPYLSTPGHRRRASLDDLIRRGVTLVIDHPTEANERYGPVCIQDFPPPRYAAGKRVGRRFPPGLTAVQIPVKPGLEMLAYYLTPNARVEEAIRTHGWKRREVADCGGDYPKRR